MPDHPNSRQPSTADSNGQPKWGWGWGVKKLIDGALCRQFRLEQRRRNVLLLHSSGKRSGDVGRKFLFSDLRSSSE